MSTTHRSTRNTWSWLPSLYFAEGLPYIIVMFVSTDMYKTMDVSNAALAFWTSILYLPWVIKPLWSPYVDMYSTKRNWIIWMQWLLALVFFGVALSLQLPWWFPVSLIFLWLLAIVSATHDIAADGFYMLGLNEHQQAFYTGIRSTFYRLAMIAGMGALVMLTGFILDRTGPETVRFEARAVEPENFSGPVDVNEIDLPVTPGKSPEIRIYPKTVYLPLFTSSGPDSAAVFIHLTAPPENDEPIKVKLDHKKGSKDLYLSDKTVFYFDRSNWNVPQQGVIKVKNNLKKPADAAFDVQSGDIALSWTISISLLGLLFIIMAWYHNYVLPKPEVNQKINQQNKDRYWMVFAGFFKKKGIIAALFFLLFYRFAESQLTRMAGPFLLDAREEGGLALSLTEKGFAYGTVGLIALVVGGIIGGIVASMHGLKRWIWWMAAAINLPNLVYVYLAYVKPTNLVTINVSIALEQFGYGFGFTGYMLYMLYLAGQGKHKTAHFAIATGFMALGMMVPGMFSGAVQESLGYRHFFIYIILCTIPSFLTLFFIRIDPGFGLKKT